MSGVIGFLLGIVFGAAGLAMVALMGADRGDDWRDDDE